MVQIVQKPLAWIKPDPNQPRKAFDEDALRHLGESLKVQQIEPLQVQPDGTLIDGERRYRAARAAMNAEQVQEPEWRKGFHAQLLLEGDKKHKEAAQRHDWELAAQYFLDEFPQMADKTRSSIMVGVMGILHVLNVGVVRELFSTTTNVTPDDLMNGKWLIVNMAPATDGDVGFFVNGAWKYMVQRAVLRRPATDSTPPTVIWADEAHQLGRIQAEEQTSGRGTSPAWIISNEELLRYWRQGLRPAACRRQAKERGNPNSLEVSDKRDNEEG